MRLIKLHDMLINEDNFIGLFPVYKNNNQWNKLLHIEGRYLDGKTIKSIQLTDTVKDGGNWKALMREAANSMLFNLEEDDQPKE